MRALLATLALPLLATACSPAACDPSQAGFFSGIGCEASGSYRSRNESQQAQLATARTAALQNDAAAYNARNDAASAQLSLAERRRRLGALDSQVAAARRQLANLRQSQGVDQDRLARAQQAVDQAQSTRAQLPAQANGAQIDATQRRLNDLLRDM